LAEAHGGAAPADLAERIAARLEAQPPLPRPFPLLAALLMAADLAVAVMTARLFGPSSAHSAQDPAPVPTVTITTEMVKAAFPPIEEPPAG
jgi:hypothetical protein